MVERGGSQLKYSLLRPLFCYLWVFILKFVFNHTISTMMVVTGNFRNAADRDGLHWRPI